MDQTPLTSGDILIYNDPKGNIRIGVQMLDDTIWLSQQQIADIFQTTLQNVRQHIDNVYEEEELSEEETRRMLKVERREGSRMVTREIEHFNLDLIISVGYRIKGSVATRFRQWATIRLREYLVKGFTMDDERLKNPDQQIGQDHFDELLARIREIRASEKRFYQKIRDIFATASNYDKDSPIARQFFQTVQNKLLYAVTGLTAAEIIRSRADRAQANMGLTSWAGSRLRRADTGTSKNYLTSNEIVQLDGLVVQFLDFAESRAQRRIMTTMEEWQERLDGLLRLNDREVLTNLGSVSMDFAKEIARQEYVAFDHARRQQEVRQSDEQDIESLTEYIASLPDEDPS